ncbi:hypothetical protein EHM76_00240 [bacterium]|nr:MAG: hypothetical protein EHM76_00240 [bacterium]
MSDYTDVQKFDELTRELAMRIRHYPAMIERGVLTEKIAQYRIKLLQQIAFDYRARIDLQLKLLLDEVSPKTDEHFNIIKD